jgi:hypothetical protein
MITVCILFAILIRASQDKDIFWVLAWPGTVVHEVLHYTVGFFLGARPVEMSVVPKTAESNTVGYVNFESLNWFNALPTAMAPLLALPIAGWIVGQVTLEWTVAGVFWIWAVSSIIAQSWPSVSDFALGTQNKVGLVFWACVVFMLIKIA